MQCTNVPSMYVARLQIAWKVDHPLSSSAPRTIPPPREGPTRAGEGQKVMRRKRREGRSLRLGEWPPLQLARVTCETCKIPDTYVWRRFIPGTRCQACPTITWAWVRFPPPYHKAFQGVAPNRGAVFLFAESYGAVRSGAVRISCFCESYGAVR